MEAGSGFDDLRLAGERRASLADDFVQSFDCFDVFVDDGLVDDPHQDTQRNAAIDLRALVSGTGRQR